MNTDDFPILDRFVARIPQRGGKTFYQLKAWVVHKISFSTTHIFVQSAMSAMQHEIKHIHKLPLHSILDLTEETDELVQTCKIFYLNDDECDFWVLLFYPQFTHIKYAKAINQLEIEVK